MTTPSLPVTIRPVQDADLPIFFEQERDSEARTMAAFASRDPNDRRAFSARWANIRADRSIILRTILYGDEVAGNVVCYEGDPGRREVGYWLGKPYWGKGIATAALRAYLAEDTRRPMFAHVAASNHASRRVLHNCGFRIIGHSHAYANVLRREIDELLLRLD